MSSQMPDVGIYLSVTQASPPPPFPLVPCLSVLRLEKWRAETRELMRAPGYACEWVARRVCKLKTS